MHRPPQRLDAHRGSRRRRRQTAPINMGGMLSMTNHPASSRARAAVDRPAPDMPVTRRTSKASWRHGDLVMKPTLAPGATVVATVGPIPGTFCSSSVVAARIERTEPKWARRAAAFLGAKAGNIIECASPLAVPCGAFGARRLRSGAPRPEFFATDKALRWCAGG